jgi:hypothetical protein
MNRVDGEGVMHPSLTSHQPKTHLPLQIRQSDLPVYEIYYKTKLCRYNNVIPTKNPMMGKMIMKDERE